MCLLGKLWLVCVCVFVCERVCLGANECVGNCGPIHHREGTKRLSEDEQE